jgi:hypothetical protein
MPAYRQGRGFFSRPNSQNHRERREHRGWVGCNALLSQPPLRAEFLAPFSKVVVPKASGVWDVLIDFYSFLIVLWYSGRAR